MRAHRFLRTSLLIVTTVMVAALAQAADPIEITEGTLIGDRDGGVIDIRGDRGFSMRAGGSTSGGVFDPAVCDQLCEPGPLGIRAFWSGSDLGGTVTIDGQSFPIGLGTETEGSAAVEFDGKIRLPPLGNAEQSITVSAPFSFTGQLSYPIATPQPPDEFLVGKGTARLTFRRNQDLGTWMFERAVYEFH